MSDFTFDRAEKIFQEFFKGEFGNINGGMRGGQQQGG